MPMKRLRTKTNDELKTIKNSDKNAIAVSDDREVQESAELRIDYYDSSDEEDLRNTIGNIPVQWYEEYGHVGYDLGGQRISKGEGGGKQKARGEIDAFLEREEDPDYWRRVFDHQLGQDVVLDDSQVQKLEAIAACKYPQIGYNPYQPFFDLFSSKKEIHPISNRPPDKRSFLPSADERRIVGRMVHSIKMGWMKRRANLEKERAERERMEENPPVYDLWASEEGDQEDSSKSKSELARLKMHWPAPKVQLPGHTESYRPPLEYLFNEEEKRKWEERKEEELNRPPKFIPQRYNSLREVPFFEHFYEERLERCMDLHLAPRQRKMLLNVDSSQLLPDLPNPADLQPFPTTLAFYMRGHQSQVRWLSIEPECGELLVSGGADSTLRVWALPNGNCLRQFRLPAPITCVQYCPDSSKTIVLVSCESNLLFVINISSGDRLAISRAHHFLDSLPVETSPENSAQIRWFRKVDKKIGKDKNALDAVQLQMKDKIRTIAWHRKGDYFATVNFEQSAGTILIHQLSKCQSQQPFTKRKGFVQSVLFHPTKPWFFVGTRQHVLIYDLAQNELKRKIFPGTKWLSCMVLHPAGDNLFIGGLDRTFSWLDLELGTKPWKKLRNHQSGIRSIAYHRRYPLLATVSDDATAIIYHARVSMDLARDNELVPVKRLFGHSILARQELKQLKEKDAKEMAETTIPELLNDKEEKNRQEQTNDESGENIGRKSNGELINNERLAILCACFHPNQPWLVTTGADGQIALFSY